MIRMKNAASRSIRNERENPATGWYAVKAIVPHPKMINSEMYPRTIEEATVSRSDRVLIPLVSRPASITGMRKPAARRSNAPIKSSLSIRTSWNSVFHILHKWTRKSRQ